MSESDTPPNKRHEALIPLSRDHYVGLVHAHRLMKAASKDRVARHKALADFLEAWRTEIEPHFRDEERLLPPLIPAQADRRRLIDDHAAITRAAEEAMVKRRAVDPDPEFVERLGLDLEEHIRWEERVVFNLVQENASPGQLEALTEATAQLERSRNRGRDGRETDLDASTQTDPSDDS
ncbi:MAG: hemerythrin domain-containing protein [Phycisphaeraceae bacterium]|nr:hemerythrin domain-containing protein [Phycisphaeraceae bacterium]MCW5762892.1 hemerythrin domain-containing protein [Phycisphaeraceae bacterium]